MVCKISMLTTTMTVFIIFLLYLFLSGLIYKNFVLFRFQELCGTALPSLAETCQAFHYPIHTDVVLRHPRAAVP